MNEIAEMSCLPLSALFGEKAQQDIFDRCSVSRHEFSIFGESLHSAIGRIQPVKVFKDVTTNIVPHHVLVVSKQACDIRARRDILQNPNTVLPSVNHVPKYIQMILWGKIYLLH